MMSQNKYDNQEFFDEYINLRKDIDNSNINEELPALFSLIDNDLKGKSILDLGCGYGENSKLLLKRNASRVVGIDISKKMLNLAKKFNSDPKISYYCIDMENIDKIEEKFDLIISSLAIHYVKDYNKLIKDVYNLLNDGGTFIFSQEHPITLAPKNGKSWNYDENRNPISFNLANYQEPGERNIFWLTNDVIKYHRTISEIMNGIIDSGFIIKKVLEPSPVNPYIDNKRNIECNHKPYFLIIKSQKK
jgi:SAM-dependent methyltransferase